MTAPPKATRGGAGRGQGRKTKSPDGEKMVARQIRMTDVQWADAQLIGTDQLRAWITRRAKRIKAAAQQAAEKD